MTSREALAALFGEAAASAIPAALAPMAGFTDAPFRALCRSFLEVKMGARREISEGESGARREISEGKSDPRREISEGEYGARREFSEVESGTRRENPTGGSLYAVTEMVSAAAIHYNDKKTAALARLDDGDGPTAVQIFGHDPAFIAEAAARIASGELCGRKPAAIDINMGCPVKKIVSAGDGSALTRSPALCGELVAAAREAAEPYGVPVTVKIRLGFSRDEVNAPEVGRACAAAGAAAICVHGRTRDQMYSGEASLEGIAKVREAVDPAIPVIGNGDIRSLADAKRMIEFCGVDGVAVGRHALSAPWIFAELRDGAFEAPSEDGRKEIALRLVRSVCERQGESGVIACRARLGFLLAGMREAAGMRRELNAATTIEDVARALRAKL